MKRAIVLVVLAAALGSASAAYAADSVQDALHRCRSEEAASATSGLKAFCDGVYAFSQKDNRKATALFITSAEAGYAPGQVYAGLSYQDGIGVAKDIHEALKWYLKAAEQGDPDGQNDYAIINYYGWGGIKPDPETAVPWFRKAADQGYANAQTMLAEAYHDGKGVAREDKEAFRLYTLAAGQKHAYAMFGLGALYMNGQGVERNSQEGAKWIERAAERNIPDAQRTLARLYRVGRGVSKDEARAMMWFEVAVLNGQDRDEAMDELAKCLTPEQIAEARSDAQRKWQALKGDKE